MNKTKILSFACAVSLLIGAGCGCSRPKQQKVAKRPAKVVVKKRQNLTYKIDTVCVTDETVENRRNNAAGVFIATKNLICINYYVPADTSQKVVGFCERNNNSYRLTYRHETEHARKAGLLKSQVRHSALVNARMAAMNEIMAPASEIIEALDYHYETGRAFETTRTGILMADSAIIQIVEKYHLFGPVNFSFQPIADAVMKYAQVSFYNSVNRGFYKSTICREFNREEPMKYTPCKESDEYTCNWLFCPEADVWNALWTFKSASGKHDIYASASPAVRQQLLNGVDSLIYSLVFPPIPRIKYEKHKCY